MEPASSIGAGWALNAGGVITRTVRGAADDRGLNAALTKYGYFHARAFLHEMFHVQALFAKTNFPVTDHGGNEMNAYYMSSINKVLPPMNNCEAETNAIFAIQELLQYVDNIANRPAAMKAFSTQIRYFLNVLPEDNRKKLQNVMKIPSQ